MGFQVHKYSVFCVFLFVCLFDGIYRHFQQYFSYIVAISSIGGGNRRTRRKPPMWQVTDKLYLLDRESNSHLFFYKYHIVGTIPKSNIEIEERGKIDAPNTQIHDHSLFWLGTGTSIKCGGVKLVLWTQISLLVK